MCRGALVGADVLEVQACHALEEFRTEAGETEGGVGVGVMKTRGPIWLRNLHLSGKRVSSNESCWSAWEMRRIRNHIANKSNHGGIQHMIAETTPHKLHKAPK